MIHSYLKIKKIIVRKCRKEIKTKLQLQVTTNPMYTEIPLIYL
jgi:hypothetical protein